MASLKDLIVLGPARFLDKLYGNLEGNASTATKLQTPRAINGTNFDGTGGITTANWGTARNIYIANSDGTGAGSAVSVNGGANATLKLPSTIKASLSGNADSAYKIKASVNLTGNSSNSNVYWNPFTWEASSSWEGCTGIYTLSDSENNFNGIFRVKFRNGNGATVLSVKEVTWLSASTATPPTLTLTTTVNSASVTYKLYLSSGANTYRTYKISKIAEEGIAPTTSTSYVTSMSGAVQSTAESIYASTATKLATARTIALAGDITGSTAFDGSENVSITTVVGNDTHNHTYKTISLLGSYVSNTALANLPNGITYVEMPSTATTTGDPTYGAMLTVKQSSNRAFQIANGSDKLYFRPIHSSSFTSDAGTGYGTWRAVALSDGGTYTMNITGNASGTASKLATPRDIKISDTTSSSVGKFDGSANTTIYIPTTISGFNEIKTKKLTITNTEGGAHLAFSRASWNYITAPASGYIAFSPNGRATSGAGATLSIGDAEVIPGYNNNAINLGSSSYKWKNIYATTFTGALSGNASTTTKLATARTINGTSFDGTENITTASWGTARTFALAQDSSGSVSVNGGSNITLKVTNNKMKGYEFISGVSPQVWYTSKVTYTNSTTPTDVWYVKVTINATWVSQLTPMLFEADYSNHSGKLILNLDALPPKWMGYLTDYSGSNIQAIRRVQNSSSKKTEIFVRLAKPTEYNGSTPVGQITVYSPYTIESIVACTATDAGDLIALRNGYNSNTSITTTAQIYGNAATATKLQTARTINGTAFDGTGNITTANWGTTRTITIGATGKSVNGSTNYSWTPYEMRVTRAQYNVGSSMNAIADHGCELGMANLSSTDTTINPGGGTSWHHYINMTWSDCADNNSVTNNEWCTQIANKAGTTDLWVRSRSGSSITDGTAWAAPWTRIVTGSNFTNVLNGTYVNVTGDTMTGDLKFTTKGLHFIPGDTDQYLWKVYSTTEGSYGFRLQYNGTGAGNDNSLSLFADNQEGTEVKAVTILQDGTAVLTVNPQFKTTNYTSTPITIYDDGTTYGHTMLIGAGGTTYIGAGESANSLYSKLAVKSTEDLILGADSNIRFYAGADSATTTNGITLNSSNYFYPQTNNTGSLGTSSYKWASVYAATFYGALSGNASSATKLTSSAGSANLPVYFSDGKPVAISNLHLGATTSNAYRDFQINRKSADDVSYGKTFMCVTSTGLSAQWGYQHFDTSGTQDYNVSVYFNNSQFRPSVNNSIALGTSSYKWSTVYATTFSGALSGNASTATAFSSNRTIALTGDVTGSASTNGSSGWSISTAVGNDTHNHTYSTINLLGSYKSNTAYTSLPTGITYVEMPATAAATGDPTYGAMLTVYKSSVRAFQLVGTTSGGLYVRGLHSGNSSDAGTGYSAWNRVVTNSGTWSISISGNAATATKLATARAINGTNFDGSGAITTANWGTARNLTVGNTTKSVNGSAAVSWPNPLKIAYYGSNTADTNGWYKVGTWSQSGHSDINLNLLVTSGYSRRAMGIIYLAVRCSNTTVNTCTALKWLCRYGFNIGDFYFVDHGNNTWSLYVQQTVSQYGRIQIQVLTETNTANGQYDLTFTSNTTKESTAPTGGVASTDGNLVYSSTEPSNKYEGMVWLKPA